MKATQSRQPGPIRRLLALVGISRADKSYRPVKLGDGEEILFQSPGFRMTAVWSYEGRATLTTERFLFQPQEYYTRPALFDAVLGGRYVELPLARISDVNLSKWKRNFWRTLPGLPILEIVSQGGTKQTFQLTDVDAEKWRREIISRRG